MIGGITFITEPAMASVVGSIIFVVVVVGGMGSLAGAFAASILIGLLQTLPPTGNRGRKLNVGKLISSLPRAQQTLGPEDQHQHQQQVLQDRCGHAVYSGLGSFLAIHTLNLVSAGKLSMPPWPSRML